MAKDNEDMIEENLNPAQALTQTPSAGSPAIVTGSPGDVLLNRDASYEEQFADRIERLKRPRKSGQPLGKHGWVFLVLAGVVLVPVLLRALLSSRQQARSKDEKFTFQRERKPPLRGPVAPEWGKEQWAAHQAQLTFRQGLAALAQQEYDEAIRLLSRYLNDHKVAAAYSARGLAFYHKKDYARAIGDYGEAIRLDRKDPLTLNNLAWVLSTCPDDKVRDGKRAVEYATRACDLSHWNRFGYLDTLAAAYAEAGHFKEAVKWQKQALDLDIEDRETLEQAQQRLKLYEEAKPYRE